MSRMQGGVGMKADKEIRILAQLLEIKTELQETALKASKGSAVRKSIMYEIRGISKAIDIIRKTFADEEKDQKELIESLENRGLKSSAWISVKRALPNQDGMYLVTFDDGFVTATEYCDNEWQLWADSGDVIAWQKVPKAYKEG